MFVAGLVSLLPLASKLRADDPALKRFETHIRPVLVEHCYECHSAKLDEPKGGLLVDSRAGLLRGGESGPAIVPGKPEESPLLEALRYESFEMPPSGRLPGRVVDAFERWIRDGAVDPRKESSRTKPEKRGIDIEAGRRYWFFQPLAEPDVPEVDSRAAESSRGANPIDAFLLRRLHEHGLEYRPPVDRRRLIRRLRFDLIGLPPTPEEVARFVADTSPDAYERLVDRLLASSRFGERWARHWLDVARFAESNGFELDRDRTGAYHYRDFVIRAFNDDQPFDEFVRWQIAGDLLAPGEPMASVATGFLVAGPYSTPKPKAEIVSDRYDELDDMVSTIGNGLLGLTLGCARCHDHKYDPLRQDDYTGIVAHLAATDRRSIELATGEQWPRAVPARRGKSVVDDPLRTMAYVAADVHRAAVHHLVRGDWRHPREVAEPGTIAVVDPPSSDDAAANVSLVDEGPRAALARWLTDVDHGAGRLLARVIVNRLWQHHFGRGLVATPNDFGTRGERPTHPELLDWLAGRLIAEGWRLKPIHRLIVTSAAYRQGTEFDAVAHGIDPEATLLWRRRPQRLEAEAIRDNMLATADLLEPVMFGPGTLDEHARRSLYYTVKRTRLVPMLQAFDAPAGMASVGRRSTTTVAPQALWLMNSRAAEDVSSAFARRVRRSAGDDPEAIARMAYEIAMSRPPTAEESAVVTAALRDAGSRAEFEDTVVAFCQVVLSLDEFVFIE